VDSVCYPDPGAIFTTTADPYVRYRPDHPAPLIDYVADLARRDAHLATAPVLDLGCGPGLIALRLAERALRVLAVDPNEDMLAAGRRLAVERGIDGIEWRAGSSATVSTLPKVGGVTIGDAFHYMDREQTLADLDAIVLPGGFVAVVVSHAIGTPKPWWEPVLDRLRDRFLGEHRAAGPGVPFRYLREDHESVLRRSPFSRVHVLRVDHRLSLDLDELIGLQSTYAFSSPAVLGEQRDAYEHALRKALTVLEPSGRFTATVQTAVIAALRP
jgi:SAM-dependent methyltransferase